MADPYGLHVLLVEDNPDERWLLGEILRARGHTVTACEDGESGWKAYQETRPPLLILDWVLPGLDGLELCRLIREEEEAPESVILVVTSRDSAEDLRLVLDAGADDYAQKPLNVSLFEIRLAVAEQRVRNLRDRDRTRHALEAKSRELEALSENLDEVFFSVDVALDDLIHVSPAAREFLGILPEALGRDPRVWKDLLLPPGLKEAEDLAGEVSRQQSLAFEYELHRPDGETRWVKSALKAGYSPEGKIVRLDGILSDLTARKVVEEELSVRNQELQTLYRVSEIFTTSSAPDEAFRQVLEEVRQATGFPMGFLERLDQPRDRLVLTESVGLEPVENVPLEIPLHETLSGVAVERQRTVAVEDARDHARLRNDPLPRQDLRSYVAFPLLASGKVHGVLTLADTEIREIPPRLLRWGESLANSLALFVERVEAELALKEGEREALALAAKLRAAEEELEAFAYSVSHDLRAPLRTMQGFAQALVQGHGEALPSQAQDFAGRIIASGIQAEGLIRDLLAYGRMSFEDLEIQEVELGPAVAEAREQVSGDITEREANLTVPDDFPTVLAHHATLVQILANLLSNAVKFVPENRKPKVVLRWEVTGGGDRIRIWVEDNGVGVSEEHQERIFKVFERLEGEIRRPGTGIGLAIVRRGVQRIGGKVGVVPGRGGGSRFWVELRKGGPQGGRPWGGMEEASPPE